MRGPAILLAVLSLSVTAHAGGKQKKKQTVRAVIDHTVGGQVVRRKVVTGPRRAKGKRFVSFERERAAAGKGWSVTDRRAAPPRDLTLAGRLEEIGARQQTGGLSIIELTRPGAHHLTGEREIRVYARGRLTKIKKLGRVAGSAVSERSVAAGTGQVVRTDLAIEMLQELEGQSTWQPVQGMAFRYQPDDPYSVHFEVGKGEWVFGRDLLADALESGASGDGDVHLRTRGELLEIELRSPDGRATLRIERQAAAAFLRQSEASVPRGSESARIDFDGDLRRIIDGE